MNKLVVGGVILVAVIVIVVVVVVTRKKSTTKPLVWPAELTNWIFDGDEKLPTFKTLVEAEQACILDPVCTGVWRHGSAYTVAHGQPRNTGETDKWHGAYIRPK